MSNLSNNVKITKVIATTGAGTTTLTGTVDMSGYDGVVFIGSMGTADATNGAKAGGGAASNGSDASDYKGSKVLSDGTGKSFVLDIYRPTDRYVTVSQIRAASTTSDGVWAIQYKGNFGPVSNTVASTQASNLVADPVLGTA